MSPARKEPDISTYRGRCAARLTQLRERAGLSVEEAAAALIEKGVIKQANTVYRWESSAALPKIENLPILASLYGLKNARSVLAES